MNGQMKSSIDSRRIFYGITMFSVLLLVAGIIITVTNNPLNGGVASALNNEFFNHITMSVPFSMWAWLIIFVIFSIKKNWVVVITCIALAVPHLILITVLVTDSYSLSEILKWCAMILSFGSIVLQIERTTQVRKKNFYTLENQMVLYRIKELCEEVTQLSI